MTNSRAPRRSAIMAGLFALGLVAAACGSDSAELGYHDRRHFRGRRLDSGSRHHRGRHHHDRGQRRDRGGDQ